MNQANILGAQYSVLSTINKVEGFDPSVLAVEYIDLTTQEKRKRLPVMAQLAWFRLKHPEGKIAISVEGVTAPIGYAFGYLHVSERVAI